MARGRPLSADSFDDLSQAIAEAGMRAITCERYGFGRSDPPTYGCDDDTLADDWCTVIVQTGARDATLPWFSMAGSELARDMSRHQGRHV